MTKIAYYILLTAPITFIILLILAMGMVGGAGHATGDNSIIFYTLIVFCILYFITIMNRLKKPKNLANNITSLLLTFLIMGVSLFYAYVITFHQTGFMFDYILIFFTYTFSLCSIVVVRDIIKSL